MLFCFLLLQSLSIDDVFDSAAFFKRMCSRGSPREHILLNFLLSIRLDLPNFILLMFFFRSPIVLGTGLVYTLLFSTPKGKNRRGLGQDCKEAKKTKFFEMSLSPNFSLRKLSTMLAICGGAPSCWNRGS